MEPKFQIAPAPYEQVQRVAQELGLSEPVAQLLVRRGYSDPAAAKRFLASDVEYSPDQFGGLAEAGKFIADRAADGRRIVVHGDYDCDGVSSTAILVRALRQIGADVDWFIPHRVDDGYGLAADTVQRLASEGAELIITVDCGITAVEEVELARELGVEVLISDHHRPRNDGKLPDTPIVHPEIGGYPQIQQAGAAVAWKLAGAVLEAAGHDRAGADIDLDLVALGTIADVMPLVDENRRLAKIGLEAITDSSRPGMRALLEVSGVSPSSVDSIAVAFRLAPRVNAVGRIGHANVAVALFLEPDPTEANRLALKLDQANRDRREIELKVFQDARSQAIKQQDPEVYVLAGEGWHAGVVGIVASRIVEEFGRPAVLLAVQDGEASGSARSVPGFDLLAGLDACSEHLLRHGGHRAAAGCSLNASEIDSFREAICAYAREHLDLDAEYAVDRVDAVVGGAQLSLELAQELQRLGPFGEGNPEPVLMVPVAKSQRLRPLGKDGKHIAFTVCSGRSRIETVAFGRETLPGPEDQPFVGTFALERNEFRGSVTPRLRCRELAALSPDEIDRLDGERADVAISIIEAADPFHFSSGPAEERSFRDIDSCFIDRSSSGEAAAIASLVSTGEAVTVVCSDAATQYEVLAPLLGGFALTDWWSLARAPQRLDGTRHLVALQPPSDQSQMAAVMALDLAQRWKTWVTPELGLIADEVERESDLRSAAAEVYRELRQQGPTPVGVLAPGIRSGWWLGVVLKSLQQSGAISIDAVERVVSVAQGPVSPLEQGEFAASWLRRCQERKSWIAGKSQARSQPR